MRIDACGLLMQRIVGGVLAVLLVVECVDGIRKMTPGGPVVRERPGAAARASGEPATQPAAARDADPFAKTS